MDETKVEELLNKHFDKTNSLIEEKLPKFGDNLKKEITSETEKELNELRIHNQEEIKKIKENG